MSVGFPPGQMGVTASTNQSINNSNNSAMKFVPPNQLQQFIGQRPIEVSTGELARLQQSNPANQKALGAAQDAAQAYNQGPGKAEKNIIRFFFAGIGAIIGTLVEPGGGTAVGAFLGYKLGNFIANRENQARSCINTAANR